jgi:hypothetical protein
MVAVLQGYFDDSGTHDGSRVVAIGGFIAREEQWQEFEREWKERVLSQCKVFRMADLENGYGEFAGWPKEKKHSLINTVTEIALRYAKHAVSGLVIAQDYDEIVPQWAKKIEAFGDEYNFCFQMCIGQSMQYVDLLDPLMPDEEKIAFMFEQQKKHEGITRDNYTLIKEFRDPQNRMGAFGFGTKQDFHPLQLADFFAYESYKHLDNLVQKSGRDIRVPLKILQNEGQSIQAHFMGGKTLERLVRHYDELGRPHDGKEPWWPWA